jgi:hypothetical protein
VSGEQTVVKATARIDWRKLLLPTLLIMVLPTISAFLLDKWLGSLPFITIAAIIICFPTATFLVIRIALQEMDRVIAEVAPPPLPEGDSPLERSGVETGVTPETESGAEPSSMP